MTPRQCRKVKYRTREQAEKSLAALREQGHYDEKCNAYLCLNCGDCFHIGHTRDRSP